MAKNPKPKPVNDSNDSNDPDWLRLDPDPSPSAPDSTPKPVRHRHASRLPFVQGNRSTSPPQKAKRKATRFIEKKYGLTPEKLIPVIFREHGLISNISKHFKIPQTTLGRYLKNEEACGQAVLDAREAMGDAAEKKLFELIKEGDVRCILYYLSTVHRARGYGLRASDDPFSANTQPVYVETVNVVAVPSGQFLPKPAPGKPKVIDH